MTALKDQVLMLLAQVPRPPGTLLPSGAQENDLTEFENSTGLHFPDELQEWLRTCNGPCVGPGGIYGIAPAPKWLTIEAHLDTEPDWKNRGWFPVAGDGTGNQYVLDSHAGSGDKHPIYFLDHEQGLTQPVYVVASHLWRFLHFLLQDEFDRTQGKPTGWPFDEAKVRSADPGVEQYQGRVPLPWETN